MQLNAAALESEERESANTTTTSSSSSSRSSRNKRKRYDEDEDQAVAPGEERDCAAKAIEGEIEHNRDVLVIAEEDDTTIQETY